MFIAAEYCIPRWTSRERMVKQIQHDHDHLSHRSICNPNLRLKRTLRNRCEVDQIHVLEVHESFTNSPFPICGFVHRMFLGIWVSHNGWVFSPECKPTAMDSRYWLSFFATSYASLLRHIRVRFFDQPKVEIYCLAQHAAIWAHQQSPPDVRYYVGTQET